MKKITAIIMAAVMLACCLCGCGENSISPENENKLKIVTTIFPEYDWVMNILGDKAADADVTMLLDNGVDLHSYQPTAKDIMKISTCDLFIYVGGESDVWIEDALKEATNKDMRVINLLDILGDEVKEEEIVEGMQGEEEEEESKEEETEYDEHVWLSLKNAQICCDVICEKLCEADTKNAESYKNNTKEYNKKLSDLDGQYKSTVDAAKYHTLLFGDRFPFRYMTDDYGLDYYAAFAGSSAETEASFETIVFLSKKTDELTLPAILTIEGAEHRIAETIRDNTQNKDQKILTLDSMQSVTSDDVKQSVTYISIMESNLSVLKEALN